MGEPLDLLMESRMENLAETTRLKINIREHSMTSRVYRAKLPSVLCMQL